ncbi:hypothetical protein SRRS_50320 [Sporomusa rhizae]|uniref:hypothetical protein n=1 Tax=Sporomusa rhizae TaxID=357999 RepID=UPI00352B452A
MNPIEEYKYLFALHLRDVSKRYGVLYYDVLKGKIPAEAQSIYAEGLARMFQYMNLRHGLEVAEIVAVHETIIETVLAEFIVSTLDTSAPHNSQILH